jgi:hypothetical protein
MVLGRGPRDRPCRAAEACASSAAPSCSEPRGKNEGDRVGFLTRRLVPRSVRRATHPVRTVRRAVTPKPIKRARRAMHPVSNAKYSVERNLFTKKRKRPARAAIPRAAAPRAASPARATRVEQPRATHAKSAPRPIPAYVPKPRVPLTPSIVARRAVTTIAFVLAVFAVFSAIIYAATAPLFLLFWLPLCGGIIAGVYYGGNAVIRKTTRKSI